MMNRTLLAVIALLFVTLSMAQENCKNSLYEANVLYETGKVKEAIERLLPCMNTKMPSEERFEASRFLAIAYQNINELEQSKIYIEKMLHQKPDYQKVPNNDPADFTRLVDQFVVSPKLDYGIQIGALFNNPSLVQSYSMFNVPQAYDVAPGFSLALTANYHINSKLQLRGALGFKGIGIQHELKSEDGWNKNYSENLRMMSLTVSPRYIIALSKKVNVYGGLNAGLGLISNSRVIVKTDNVKENSTEYNTRDGLTDKNKMQPHFGLLAGFNFPLQRGALELEVSYDWYLSNVTNKDQRFSDPDFIFLAQYTADDIKLRVFQLSLNYTLPGIYRIKKP